MRRNDVNTPANRARVLVYAYLNLNLGDDLFVRMLADRYPSVDFYVFSSQNYERIINRKNLFVIRRNRINRIFSSHLPYQYRFRRFDAMVYIGGSIFMERGESGECTTTRILDKFHKSFPNVPIHIIGSNYGPEQTPAFRSKVEQVFGFVESVCLRDNYSYKIFAPNPKVTCASDVVFGLLPQGEVKPQQGSVGLSVIDLDIRPSIAQFRDSYERKMAHLVEYHCRQGHSVSLLSFCKAEGDERACQRIVAQLPAGCASQVRIVGYDGSIDPFVNHIRSLETLYATRFHATILGVLFGVATLPIIYSDKTQYALADMAFDGDTFDLRKESRNIEELQPATLDSEVLKKLKKSSQNQFVALDKTLAR